MASVMAIVSKAVFEKAARGLSVGDCWDVDHYDSQNKGLAPLADGGDLYLVTVRPPETLWLAAVLRSPKRAGEGWKAAANAVAIREIDALRSQIKFTSGVGITAKAGALGMSLQTPRVLTDDDVRLLSGGNTTTVNKATPAKTAKPTAKPAAKPAAKPTAKPMAKPIAKPAAKPAPRPSAKPAANMERAVAAAASGDWADALAICLFLWRATKSTPLADTIVQIGAALPAVKIDDWLDVAGERAPEKLDGLLATLLDKGSVKGRERVEALVEWPEDPRIDRWVAELFKAPPYTSTGARPFWTRVQPLTKRIVDNTAITTIAKARKSEKVRVYDFLGEYIDKAALVAQPEIEVDAKAITAIKAAGAKKQPASNRRADTILEEFLADPSNDDALAPLADALIEAGDPRGELITAQLDGSPAAEKRATEIIKKHREALLGPLAAALLPEVKFRRGFAVSGKIRRGSSSAQENAIAKSVGHVLWSTIEHLEGPDDYDVTLHPIMRSLRSIAHTDVGLAELAKMKQLEILDEGDVRGDGKGAEPLFDTGFPALKRLSIVFVYGDARKLAKKLLESPLAKRLDAIDVGVSMGLSRGFADYAGMRKKELAEFAALAAPAIALGIPVTLRGLHSSDKGWGSYFEIADSISVGIKAQERLEEAIVEDMLAMLDAIAKTKAAEVSLDGPPKSKKLKKLLDDKISSLRRP